MNDLFKYRLQIGGRVDEDNLNASSPLEVKVERVEADSTWLSVLTDQSGLVGLMRHLHGMGFALLSIQRGG